MTGQQLKYEIKRRGYTLRQLAQIVGTPPQNLSRKLMADDVPTSLIEQAATMMGISPAEFYGAGDTIQATASQSVAFKGTQNIACDPRLLDVIQQQQAVIATLQQQQQTVIDTLQRQQQAITDLLRQSAGVTEKSADAT